MAKTFTLQLNHEEKKEPWVQSRTQPTSSLNHQQRFLPNPVSDARWSPCPIGDPLPNAFNCNPKRTQDAAHQRSSAHSHTTRLTIHASFKRIMSCTRTINSKLDSIIKGSDNYLLVNMHGRRGSTVVLLWVGSTRIKSWKCMNLVKFLWARSGCG